MSNSLMQRNWAHAAQFLVFAALPLHALLTWQVPYTTTFIRHYSITVLAIELAVIVSALLVGRSLFRTFQQLHPITRIAALVIIGITGVTTLLVAPDRYGASIHLIITIIHCLFAVAAADMLASFTRLERRHLAIALALGLTVYGMISYALALSVRNDPDFNWWRFGAGVTHVRHIGYYGVALTGLAGGLLVSAPDSRRMALFMLPLTMGFALTAWSGARTSFIAAIGIILLLIALAPRAGRLRASQLCLLSFAIALPLSALFIPAPFWGIWRILSTSLAQGGDLNSYSTGRLTIWRETLKLIAERPLLGHGEGQFRQLITVERGLINHPHNALLQVLFQWGVIGTLAVVVLVMNPLRNLRNAIRKEAESAFPAIGLLGSLGAISVVDDPLFYPFPLVMVILALIILASPVRTPEATSG